jgi:hypothetical protein
MALGFDSAPSENEYQQLSWGLRRPVREADNLTTFTCRMSCKSGSLNLLEPSGPHRACYGTALPYLQAMEEAACDDVIERLTGIGMWRALGMNVSENDGNLKAAVRSADCDR